MLQGLVPRRARRAAAAGGATSLGERLSRLPEAERDQVLVDLVAGEAATVLRAQRPAIDRDRTLRELGLDSLMAVELRNRLGAATGLRLPATLLFDHPTPAALARYLVAKLCADAPPVDPRALEKRELETAVASMPLQRLRQAGLLDTLVRLAQQLDARGSATTTIDDMNVDALVDLALCNGEG
jgi:polyketide synthase 12